MNVEKKIEEDEKAERTREKTQIGTDREWGRERERERKRKERKIRISFFYCNLYGA